jgi:hypothetical protein
VTATSSTYASSVAQAGAARERLFLQDMRPREGDQVRQARAPARRSQA